MELNKIPNISKGVEYKYLSNETFILDVHKGRFFKLDKVGTDIWKLINGKRNINEIVRILYKKYDVEIKDLEKDVMEFFNIGLKYNILSKT